MVKSVLVFLYEDLCMYICFQGRPQKHQDLGLKKRVKLDQDTINEDYHLTSLVPPGNDTEFWKRPRCGVPDYPASKQIGLSFYNMKKKGALGRQQRRKRFVLFGGRWEKTDLTYK